MEAYTQILLIQIKYLCVYAFSIKYFPAQKLQERMLWRDGTESNESVLKNSVCVGHWKASQNHERVRASRQRLKAHNLRQNYFSSPGMSRPLKWHLE